MKFRLIMYWSSLIFGVVLFSWAGWVEAMEWGKVPDRTLLIAACFFLEAIAFKP